MKKIDFEAHFYTEDYLKTLQENEGYPRFLEDKEGNGHRLWYFSDVGQPFATPLLSRLLETGEERLAVMDACGIDVQILSLSAPGLEQLDPQKGAALARETNDVLSQVIKKQPDRFMGYAALAPKNPDEAADELERAVSDLGFMGWNTHSNYGDSYLDDRKYWPILERAERLGVPVYLHPTIPAIPQLRDYGLALAGASFGFGFETALCMMRLILSGVFDRYPGLTFILGHFGEALPFLLKRMDWAYIRTFPPGVVPTLKKKPSEYLQQNVFVTTSGRFSKAAFMCTYEEMGIGRILFGTDYPYEDTQETIDFLEGLPVGPDDRSKIYYQNAEDKGLA